MKTDKNPRLFYTPTDGHQAGALLYTNRLYRKLDRPKKFDWIIFLELKKKWKLKQKRNGNLVCSKCGKKGLKLSGPNKNILATLDHILPISKYPHLKNDENNFQILCYPCNREKSNYERNTTEKSV